MKELGGVSKIPSEKVVATQIVCLNFHPDPWGCMIQVDEHILQMGWFNHQLAS